MHNHIHTYMHTYLLTYLHTHTHIRNCTDVHTFSVNTCTHTYVRTHMLAMYIRARTYVHTSWPQCCPNLVRASAALSHGCCHSHSHSHSHEHRLEDSPAGTSTATVTGPQTLSDTRRGDLIRLTGNVGPGTDCPSARVPHVHMYTCAYI